MSPGGHFMMSPDTNTSKDFTDAVDDLPKANG